MEWEWEQEREQDWGLTGIDYLTCPKCHKCFFRVGQNLMLNMRNQPINLLLAVYQTDPDFFIELAEVKG